MTEVPPTSFEINHLHRLRIATFRGVITEQILFDSYGALVSQSDYDATLNDLVDLRAVERLDVSSEGIRRLVEMFSGSDGLVTETKLAIVASANHVFGMARMYEILSSDTPEQIQVFRDIQAAEKWLGIELNGNHS